MKGINNCSHLYSKTMDARKSQHKIFHKCSLPQCSGLRFSLVHKFPRKIERAKIWLQTLDCPRLYDIPHLRLVQLSLCCRHFRVEDYVHPTARTLNYVAVPSLNLKKLNELNKCRQTETEKPSVLTFEEIAWLKDEVYKQQFLNNESNDENEMEIPTKIDSSKVDNLAITPVETLMKASPKIFSPQRATITSTSKVLSAPNECIVSSSLVTVADPQLDQPIEGDIHDFELVVNEGFLKIVGSQWNDAINLDILWLRSICHCSICYDDTKSIPKINFINLPVTLQPVMATVTEESRKLEIIWSDGHTSTYSLNELYDKLQFKSASTCFNNYLLWNSQHITYRDDLKPLKFYEILAHKTATYTALDRLQKSGVLIIQDIPKCERDSVLKKSLISRIFNHLWDNLITEKRTSFSNHYSTPITNCTFESMDKGLQILTVPYYKENLRMELCLVDGFQAASKLHKTSYEFLTQYSMEFGFTSNQGYKHITKHPIIEENLKRITYSPYHMENIKSQDFKQISMHLKNFNDLLNLKHNQWNVELNAETIIILDNFRICWCINQPQVDSELDCFYMERKHYLSSLNVLKVS